MHDSVLAPSILLALPIKRNHQYQQEFSGDAAYAGGGRVAARQGAIIPLDLPFLASPLALAKGALGVPIAAAAVRAYHALLRDLIVDDEDANAWAAPPHPDAQMFFVVALKRTGGTLAAGGQIDKALAEIARQAAFDQLAALCPLSINQLLKSVRDSAAKAGVSLPPRFTMTRSHPDYETWLKSLAERRKLADERWNAALARGTTRRAKARAPA